MAQKYLDGINNDKIIMPLKSNDEYKHIYHILQFDAKNEMN